MGKLDLALRDFDKAIDLDPYRITTSFLSQALLSRPIEKFDEATLGEFYPRLTLR